MGAETEERPQQVVCYRAGNYTEAGLDIENKRESEDLKFQSFAGLLDS